MDKIGIPSRFACLKIEDDDVKPSTTKNSAVKKKLENKEQSQNKNTAKNSVTNSKQNMPNTKKSKANKAKNKQWEEWQEKDNEMVEENYEQDLQNAILQSKMDFESKSKKPANGVIPKKDSIIINKKKKTKTMSLDQFLEGPEKEPTKEDPKDNGDDEGYFEKLMEATKREVKKGKIEEERKQREMNIDKTITIAQLQDQLCKESKKNAELGRKFNGMKEELGAVKARNKTLCSILGQAEMREKAELLLELERLNLVKDELTEEVTKLHEALEQERSSKTSNQELNKKDKKRKKIA